MTGQDTGDGRLWTVSELAERLRVTPSAIHRWVRIGTIPGVVRVGPGTLRFDPVAIARWVQAGGLGKQER